MGTIATIATVVLFIFLMTFIAFFGRLPALRRTPIAWLHRCIWVYLPNGVLALDQILTSGRATSSCARFGRFIANDRHPTILIFFFLLLTVGEYLYLPTAWPRLTPVQKVTGAIAIILPYLFLYLAAFSDPGFITAANHAREMARYPFDHSLFHPGAACRTCRLPKPPRSKHCSVCKRCVSRLDHHCVFINNCVGAANQHYFLLLLITTGVLTLYGACLGVHLMATAMRARFPVWTLLPWRGPLPFKQWLVVWTWGLQDAVAMGAVTLLAGMTTPLVWGLLGYHAWLIWCGTTTNESLKWSDWQAEMDDGFAFKRRMAADRPKDPALEPGWTRWPAETEQILVRTDDGEPPASHLVLPGEGEWERVWRLRDVENLYDLGFWDNLVDVFLPDYVFRDPQTPVAERKARRRGKKRART